MRYYIIAGEASGDLHGSNLIRSIRQQDPAAEIRAWGGDKMEDAGAKLVKHYRDLAFMGFVEVIKHLGTIMKNLDFCKKDIESFKPDVLVLIDYPGFNMRIAKWARPLGYRIAYYISPQIWALERRAGACNPSRCAQKCWLSCRSRRRFMRNGIFRWSTSAIRCSR